MSKPSWIKFPDPPDMDGFNLPGLELFLRGGQVASVIRETGQNTVDNPAEKNGKVKIEYRRYEIPCSEFPGRDELLKVIKACLDFGKESGQNPNDDSMQFIQNAFDLLSNELNTVPMLEISDSYTTGIEGEDKDFKMPWARMTDAIGISDGAESTRGGSRGIGKFAPLLLSSLRTIFISTKTENNVAFKGAAQFTSFRDENNEYSAKVKFQKDKKSSIRKVTDIPSYFVRKEKGTSIHIAGFMLGESWMDEIISAVLTNFYAAIHKGRLVVEGAGEKVDAKSLKKYIDSHADDQTKMFFSCLTDGEFIEGDIKGVGQVELYVKIDEEFTKRIEYMRDKRMKIFDEKKGPLLTKKFAAVFICDGDEGSKKLRLMEGAEHVNWKPRNTEEKNYLNKVKGWIYDNIRAFEPDDEEEETEVSGTENLLPMVDDGDGKGSGGNGGQAIKEETAKEKVLEREDEIEVPNYNGGGVLLVNPDGTISMNKKKPKNRKRKTKVTPTPTASPDDVTTPKKKRKRKKNKEIKINLDRFETTVIKNTKEEKEYHLYINSDLDKNVKVDLKLFVVAEHGERIPEFNVLKGATYSDGSKIVKSGGSDELKKVELTSGLNKIVLKTKDNAVYAFNIEGHESN